jgi:hypothetical protein
MGFSPLNGQQKRFISVAGDARWDKRRSRRKNDSLSGCSVVHGNWSQRSVGQEELKSRTCIKCLMGAKEHVTNICSKNYEGLH